MLSDTAVKNAKVKDKPFKLPDEKGLYLLVTPTGEGGCGKYWRMDYRYEGKRKTLAVGVYPDVGLKDARDKREAARKLLAAGVDPSEHRKATKAAKVERASNSFEVIAREWLEQRKDTVEPAQTAKTLARMVNDVFPWIGGKAITEITAPDVLSVMKRMDERGARYTAHRVRSEISRAFRYAIATGRAERDPCPDLKGAIPSPRSGNFASITEPAKVAEMLRLLMPSAVRSLLSAPCSFPPCCSFVRVNCAALSGRTLILIKRNGATLSTRPKPST